ncbi:MAG: diaminopimelate decarboxylase [Rhodospirillaceae bacterium]|mgnify:CR=1 FL=1|nr:diaminopimelate decarboxylase [Rhodospirillaceae bacterium]
MSRFAYRKGRLHAEDADIGTIAAEIDTPFFLYASGAIEDAYREFASAVAGLDSEICYAVKANGNVAVIATLARMGAGADIVSEGELHRAIAAGVPADRIVFAGVGKTGAEMKVALEIGIRQFNVESDQELALLDRVAQDMGRRATVALRINPDVDARTHAKISTGKAENKFGIEPERACELYAAMRNMRGIAIGGIAVHIGSQLMDIAPYRAAFARVADLTGDLIAAGIPIQSVDLGGGLGINYGKDPAPSLTDYADAVRDTVAPLGLPIVFEPGRRLVGEAGILVTRVIYVKQGRERTFLIVDAAMNDLIRPALYDAYHPIVPVLEPAAGAPVAPVDVVGPICESGDVLAVQRSLPAVEPGALLAIGSCGAYGAVMASGYNARLTAPEIMVRGGSHAIVKPRPGHEFIIGQDRLPDWIDRPAVARNRVVA